jgi:hypothetical protein
MFSLLPIPKIISCMAPPHMHICDRQRQDSHTALSCEIEVAEFHNFFAKNIGSLSSKFPFCCIRCLVCSTDFVNEAQDCDQHNSGWFWAYFSDSEVNNIKWYRERTKQVDSNLTLLAGIWDVPSLNLGQDTSYPDFLTVFLSPLRQVPGWCLKLSLPRTFQFIYPSYNTTYTGFLTALLNKVMILDDWKVTDVACFESIVQALSWRDWGKSVGRALWKTELCASQT